jgi:hypothetical protein
MIRKGYIRSVVIASCMLLALTLLSIGAATAAIANWKREASGGIGNPDDWHLAAGPVFKGNLIIYSAAFIGIQGPHSGGLYTFDGNVFSQVGSTGFGNPSNRGLLANVLYHGDLYIGTANSTTGCELFYWDGSTNPQLIVNNGFGEGSVNDTCIPVGVINDELYITLSNRTMSGTGGMRLYKFDGSTLTKVMGPSMPVTGGFGNQNNEACAFAAVMNNQLVMPVLNTKTGMEVWTYDGISFNRIGKPGDPGLWSDNQIGGIAQFSDLENKVYMGTMDDSGTEGAELYTYDGSAWTKVKSGGLGGGVNDSLLQPSCQGDKLFVATLTFPPLLQVVPLTNTCRVYMRNGNSFDPISEVGFGDSSNWGTHVWNYRTKLIGTTLNLSGGQVWSTTVGPSTFYFAEGYTGQDFQEYICLGNPGDTPADATITYMFPDGSTQPQQVQIPPNSRSTVDVNAAVGAGKMVSARIESAQQIIAERPIYFNTNGVWTGGHDAVGATNPSREWYFAEGYTGPGFEEYICVLNPGDSPANLTFFFQTQEEGEKQVTDLSVDPHSRQTFRANDILGPNYQTSLKLTSDQPVVAERPMYFDYLGTAERHWTGGHCVMGTPTLANEYYFAEGTTRPGFEEWLTLQNPNPGEITITATYQLGQDQGGPVQRTYKVPGTSRRTVYVNHPDEGVGADKDVSVLLTSDYNFLAERPTYFDYTYAGAPWTGGHCVIGAIYPATEWFFAEGYTGSNFNQWLCLQNPGDSDATVEITYYTQEEGALPVRTETIAARTRKTLMVNENAGRNYMLSTRVKVTSGSSIVAERPMYFDFNGVWTGGHDVVGFAP